MKVGICGNGMVGSAMHHLFKDALVYDINPMKCNNTKEEINECDIVFICVPTDGVDGQGYNYRPLKEIISWLRVPIIVIKSTVEPGTTDKIMKETNKNIVFNPEFLREKTRFKDVENESRIIIGTDDKTTFEALRDLYLEEYDHDKVDIVRTSPSMAEMVKIVNNSYFAAKVTFCNEIKKILDKKDLDYEEFRRIWLLEPRIGKNHTLITKEGGFSGYCLPKDLKALIHTSEIFHYNPTFLKEIWNTNCRIRKEFHGKEYR